MNLVFDKSSISIDGKTCDLENFKEKEFFVILEKIIENKDEIKIIKENNVTPLGERFYEILSDEINESINDLD